MKNNLNNIYIADNIHDKRIKALLKLSIRNGIQKIRKSFQYKKSINVIVFDNPIYKKDILVDAQAIDDKTILMQLNYIFLKDKSDKDLKNNFEANIVHELVHCLRCQNNGRCFSRSVEDFIIEEGIAVYLEALLCDIFPSTLREFKGKIESHAKYSWKKFNPILKKKPINIVEFQYRSFWVKSGYVLGFYIVNSFVKNRVDNIKLQEFIKMPKRKFILFAKRLFNDRFGNKK